MSKPLSFDMALLKEITDYLDELASGHSDSYEAKLQMLEAWSSRLGGFDLESYWNAFLIRPLIKDDALKKRVGELENKRETVDIPAPFLLSSLAQASLENMEKRRTGAYYTDFRLASLAAQKSGDRIGAGYRIVDFACGSGILLVAAALEMRRKDPEGLEGWLRDNVYAYDLSQVALRGARIALASLTPHVDTIVAMTSHWAVQDSLIAEATGGARFDLVIGNPPWEKVRLTRHEFIAGQGGERSYGDSYQTFDQREYRRAKQQLAGYAQDLKARYPLIGRQEPDLYMPFVEKAVQSLAPGGRLSLFLPAGLIRSQGTEALRRYVTEKSSEVDYTLFSNRARFFSIDTRFKFVLLSCRQGERDCEQGTPVSLSFGEGTDSGVETTDPIVFWSGELSRVRPDLTLPEIRSREEKAVYDTMVANGVDCSHPQSRWYPLIQREVDMTIGKKHFRKRKMAGCIPVIEGRMVQQHRVGAKRYVSGQGRTAIWKPVGKGNTAIRPQFWMSPDKLPPGIRDRAGNLRGGFCDIAGQTNERAMAAAMIPAGVVCGNKVPTVCFADDPDNARLFLWVGVVNSLPFDWLLRRVLTTSVNIFVLLSVPMPPVEPESEAGREIIAATRELSAMSADSFYGWSRMPLLRARIDALVAKAYGLRFEDLRTLFEDFPLLDRKQPPLVGESRSTVTRDCILLAASEEYGEDEAVYRDRVDRAREKNAVPYIPTEMVDAVLKKGDV